MKYVVEKNWNCFVITFYVTAKLLFSKLLLEFAGILLVTRSILTPGLIVIYYEQFAGSISKAVDDYYSDVCTRLSKCIF